MIDSDKKVLDWVNAVASDKVSTLSWCPLLAKKALARAIERIEELEATEADCSGCDYAKPLMELQAEYDAFRREVSDAVEKLLEWPSKRVQGIIVDSVIRFIIPKPVDPLVEAWLEAFPGDRIDDAREECAKISAALSARGLEIREKQP